MSLRSPSAIILVAHGEGERLSFKEHYYLTRRIFHHAESLVNLPNPLRILIATIGSLSINLRWLLTGYRSPHNRLSRAQAEELRKIIEKESKDISIHLAYSSTPPYFETVLEEVKEGIPVVVVSLNPINSDFSCGILCQEILHSVTKKNTPLGIARFRVIGKMWDDPRLLSIYEDHVRHHTEAINRSDAALVVALHGTIVKDRNGNVPTVNAGLEETRRFAELMVRRFESTFNFAHVKEAYLNHAVGGEWTRPTLEETATELRKKGIKKILFFAGGYFSDNSETEGAAKKTLKKCGFREVIMIPCINDAPPFLDWIKDRALATLNANYGLNQAAFSHSLTEPLKAS